MNPSQQQTSTQQSIQPHSMAERIASLQAIRNEPVRWLHIGNAAEEEAGNPAPGIEKVSICLASLIESDTTPALDSERLNQALGEGAFEAVSWENWGLCAQYAPDLWKTIQGRLAEQSLCIVFMDNRSDDEQTAWPKRPAAFWLELLNQEGQGCELIDHLDDSACEILMGDSQWIADYARRHLSDPQALSIETPADLSIYAWRTLDGQKAKQNGAFYLHNHAGSTLQVSALFKGPADTHPDLFLGQQKLTYLGYQEGAHRWHALDVFPGGHRFTIAGEFDPSETTLALRSQPVDRDAALERLSFDHYQRYRLASQIVEAFQPSGYAVLDVGGALGQGSLFLPDKQITIADYAVDETPSAIQYGGKTLPWNDQSFSTVLCIDTLEHVPAGQRSGFVQELCRVTGELLVISCPFQEDGVAEIEGAMRDLLKHRWDRHDRFLQEHEEYGLPDVNEISAQLEDAGWSVIGLPNGYLPRWFAMQCAEYALGTAPELAETRARINALYNRNYYQYDNRFPAYRIALIAKREPLTESERVALTSLVSSEHDLPPGEMWNVAGMIAELGQNQLLREKEIQLQNRNQQIERLLEHAQNLEQTLAESQSHANNLSGTLQANNQHFSNLQTHIANLEHERTENQKHIQNLDRDRKKTAETLGQLQQHTQNLEEMLQEREQHIADLMKHSQNLQSHSDSLQAHSDNLQEHLQHMQQHAHNLEQLLSQVHKQEEKRSHALQNGRAIIEQEIGELPFAWDFSSEKAIQTTFTEMAQYIREEIIDSLEDELDAHHRWHSSWRVKFCKAIGLIPKKRYS